MDDKETPQGFMKLWVTWVNIIANRYGARPSDLHYLNGDDDAAGV
jgi:hypothetical protein